jgi:molybdopterin-guanine dinucleotide biosynthesis protein A
MKQIDFNKLDAACLILAGGEGKRFTPDKPMLEIGGKPIIERAVRVLASIFEEVILVTNTPERYSFLELPHVADERPGCGPLMGIHSGFKGLTRDIAFVCAADMPFLNERIIRAEFEELYGYDIVVPYPHGRPEFLHAYYRRSCLPAIKKSLDSGRFKIDLLHEYCTIRKLNDEWFAANNWIELMDKAFANINTPADYKRWRRPDSPDK